MLASSWADSTHHRHCILPLRLPVPCACNFSRSPRPSPSPSGGRLPASFRPCRRLALPALALPALPGHALPVARPWVLVPWPWPRVDTHFGVWYWRPPASFHVPYELPCVGGNLVIVTYLAGYVPGLIGPHCVCGFCRAVAWKCMLLVCIPFCASIVRHKLLVC